MATNKNEKEEKQALGSFSLYFRRDIISVQNLIVAEVVKKYLKRTNVKYTGTWKELFGCF
jgi:hypothetical protein